MFESIDVYFVIDDLMTLSLKEPIGLGLKSDSRL